MELKCFMNAFARPKFPSLFSKSIGFTLCGIVDDPTSPSTALVRKYPSEMYDHMSRLQSRSTLLNRTHESNSSDTMSCGSICVEYLFFVLCVCVCVCVCLVLLNTRTDCIPIPNCLSQTVLRFRANRWTDMPLHER